MRNGAAGLRLVPVEGIGEVDESTDLVGIIAGVAGLVDGDVVVITSKVISKQEGRLRRGDRAQAILDETVRVVARRGETAIVENRLGLVMAAAGVDASNVEPGSVVLLPEDPDASARRIREGVHELVGRNVAVVVSDTSGRAWRTGQTDIAIGVAGLVPLQDHAGAVDPYGNPLAVTEPAVADEIAGAAELVSGKLGGRPVTVVSGLDALVLPAGEHGPGAVALIRPRSEDMFGLGAREAVVAALGGDGLEGFGAPASAVELSDGLRRCGIDAQPDERGLRVRADAHGDVLEALVRAHRWQVVADQGDRSVVLLAPLS